MERSHRMRVFAGAIAVALALAACAKPEASPRPPEPAPGERVPYVIGIPDVLRINVWKNKELTIETVVRSDGMISVPLLGDVQAEGLRPEELTQVLSQRLSEYISAPDVTVSVMRADSLAATVVGAVYRSGVVPIQRQTRVLEAIAFSGGFTTWARRNEIRILRPMPEGMATYYFNYGAYLSGDDPDGNMLLKPGDTVVVPD